MLNYIIYDKPHTTIYTTQSVKTVKRHMIHVMNTMLRHSYNDLISYKKHYKIVHGNTYHTPIFINAHTTLIVIYGLRNTYNVAINVCAIEYLNHLHGFCEIQFENDRIVVQKSCKYLKKMIENAKQIHTKLLENIFIL